MTCNHLVYSIFHLVFSLLLWVQWFFSCSSKISYLLFFFFDSVFYTINLYENKSLIPIRIHSRRVSQIYKIMSCCKSEHKTDLQLFRRNWLRFNFSSFELVETFDVSNVRKKKLNTKLHTHIKNHPKKTSIFTTPANVYI